MDILVSNTANISPSFTQDIKYVSVSSIRRAVKIIAQISMAKNVNLESVILKGVCLDIEPCVALHLLTV